MDRIKIPEKLIPYLSKYKYVFVVLMVGIIFLIMGSREGNASDNTVINQAAMNTISVEEQLSNILTNMKGAGKVQVMLSIAKGEETLYQTDTDITANTDRETEKTDTVTITDSNRNQSGLIRQVNPPTYTGAIIVCQGADSPSVRYAITEAVSKITGLGADRITVLKMK